MSPTLATLRKYGMTQEDFDAILLRQGGICPICEKAPTTGRWIIDHKHVPKYKRLPPEERKKLVRGILCWVCNNRLLTRGVTARKLRNAADYLDRFEERLMGQIK